MTALLRALDSWRLVDVALVALAGSVLGALACAAMRDITSGSSADAVAAMPAVWLLTASMRKMVLTAGAGMGVSPSFAAQSLRASSLGMANEDVTARMYSCCADANTNLLKQRDLTVRTPSVIGDGGWETASPTLARACCRPATDTRSAAPSPRATSARLCFAALALAPARNGPGLPSSEPGRAGAAFFTITT